MDKKDVDIGGQLDQLSQPPRLRKNVISDDIASRAPGTRERMVVRRPGAPEDFLPLVFRQLFLTGPAADLWKRSTGITSQGVCMQAANACATDVLPALEGPLSRRTRPPGME